MPKSRVLMLVIGLVAHASTTDYNVRDFGAKGNGIVLDHQAINAAIDTCVAHGGGRVVLPAGTYLCGSIRMKSHVELHLTAGAKILAAPASMKAYDEAEKFQLKFRGGGKAELAKKDYREQGTNYPEPKFAKETPAYGLFARHVDGLEVHNVTFRTMKPDYRPAAMLIDVKNASVTDLQADLQKGAKLIVKK